MKYFIKLSFALLLSAVSFTPAFSKEDEDLEFEPIHETILPGEGRLKIDEYYDKNNSLRLVGDELVFESKKLNLVETTFELPVNPQQDYTIEYTLNIPSIKNSAVIIGTNEMATSFGSLGIVKGGKGISVCSNGIEVFKDKKWKIPESSNKNECVVKFEKRKKIITLFINGKYVFEVTTKDIQPRYIVTMALMSLKGTMTLQSIKIDQGPEVED